MKEEKAKISSVYVRDVPSVSAELTDSQHRLIGKGRPPLPDDQPALGAAAAIAKDIKGKRRTSNARTSRRCWHTNRPPIVRFTDDGTWTLP